MVQVTASTVDDHEDARRPCHGRTTPESFRSFPCIRSYGTMVNGRLHHVEVRRDPLSGHTVQVATPMADTLQPI